MPLTKVTAGVIAANAVVDSFGTQSITGDKLGLTAINANNIVDGTITGAKIAANTIPSADLTTTGVSAGSYGGASNVSSIVIDSAGRITFAANVSIGGSSISSGTSNVSVTSSDGNVTIGTAGTERMRIDSSGRVLINATAVHGTERLLVNGDGSTGSGDGTLTLRRGSNAGNGDGVGIINFADTRTSSIYARIQGIVTADPGTNDFPGALAFYTTADGASSTTERARISSSGVFYIGKTVQTLNTAGTYFDAFGEMGITRNASNPMLVNRTSNDGALVEFYQDGTLEGTISVSGTTVSYNGGNLSRYAQMLTKPDLLKGTVMSNLDEMNVYIAPTTYWTEEDELPEGANVGDVKVEEHAVDNEQLNKVKVSDVEGDVNVAGVFVNWEYDKAHQVDEINMAMTGDMIIRIAQGVVVQKGDLLMSAGDGTAKPQGDDIVRSKTVAKVTSNHVTCTYEDGSYCVPCVLMAC